MADSEIRTGIGVMVDFAAIAQGAPGDEQAMLTALSSLTRDDALFHCAKVNTIATGFDPNLSHADRQRRLAQSYCDPDQVAAINGWPAICGAILETERTCVVEYQCHEPQRNEFLCHYTHSLAADTRRHGRAL